MVMSRKLYLIQASRTGFTSFDSGLYAQKFSPYEATFKNDGDGTFSVTNFKTVAGPNLNGALHVVAGSAIFVEGEFFYGDLYYSKILRHIEFLFSR